MTTSVCKQTLRETVDAGSRQAKQDVRLICLYISRSIVHINTVHVPYRLVAQFHMASPFCWSIFVLFSEFGVLYVMK